MTRRASRSSRSPSRSPVSPTGPRRSRPRARATSTCSSSRRQATTAPTAAAYGDISGPGGAPDALTVGALDTRPDEADVHVIVRSGLGPSSTRRAACGRRIATARPRPPSRAAAEGVLHAQRRQHRRGSRRASFRRCGLPPSGPREAGAAAVLLYGRSVTLPARRSRQRRRRARHRHSRSRPAHAVLARLAAGARVTVTLGAGRRVANAGDEHVAPFSSTGLAFDGSVKPDLVAPGVASRPSAPTVARLPSAARALRLRLPPERRRSSRKRGPRSAPQRSRDCSSGPRGRSSTIRLPRRAPARSTSPPLRPARSPPRPRRSRSGRRARRAARSALHSRSRTFRRAADGRARIRTQHEGAATVDFTLRPSHVVPRARAQRTRAHRRADGVARRRGTQPPTARSSEPSAAAGRVRIPWAIAFVARPVDLIGTASLVDDVLGLRHQSRAAHRPGRPA